MKYTLWSSCLVLSLLAASPLKGQNSYVNSPRGLDVSAPGIDSNSVVTIKARVNEVNVLFIAMDKHGKFVRNLSQGDFNILDDHQPPQSIVSFRRETDLPIELGLLVDTSGSVHSRFAFEQDAAVSFLQRCFFLTLIQWL